MILVELAVGVTSGTGKATKSAAKWRRNAIAGANVTMDLRPVVPLHLASVPLPLFRRDLPRYQF